MYKHSSIQNNKMNKNKANTPYVRGNAQQGVRHQKWMDESIHFW